MKKILISLTTVILIFSVTKSKAQNKTAAEIDAQTYKQYLNGEWKGLINTGRKALKNNVDFYFLRMRMGIAYYNKKNYIKSKKYFSSIYDEQTENNILNEYLYYSYLFSGNTEQARFFAQNNMSENLYNALALNYSTFSNIGASYSYGLQTTYTLPENYTYQPIINEIGEQTITKNFSTFSLDMQLNLNKKWTYFHSYQNLTKNVFKKQIPPVNYSQDIKVTQHQYYGKLQFRIAENSFISGGGHFVHYSYPVTTQLQVTPRRVDNITITEKENDYLFFSNYKQIIGNFDVTLFLSYSTLSGYKQIQKNMEVIYYPLGNLNLYGSFSALHHTQIANETTTNNLYYKTKLGVKIVKNLWVETYAGFGELTNFSLNNGYIIYNDINEIGNILGGNLIILSNNSNLKISLGYNFSQWNSRYYSFTTGNFSNKLNYNIQTFTGGIIWNF